MDYHWLDVIKSDLLAQGTQQQALEELEKIKQARQAISDQLKKMHHAVHPGWTPLSSLKCEADPLPPVVIGLIGTLIYQPYCLGTYVLSEEMSAHGRPVWMHETGDLCIGKIDLGLWAVQDKTGVGLNNSVRLFLPDTTAVFPHQSMEKWKETDGEKSGKWYSVVGLKCEPTISPPAEKESRQRQLDLQTISKLASGIWTEHVEKNSGVDERILMRLSSLEAGKSEERDTNVVKSNDSSDIRSDSDRTQSYSDDPEYQDDDESDKSLLGHETSILAGADQSTSESASLSSPQVLQPMFTSQSSPGKACSVCNEKKEFAAFSPTQWKTKAHKRKCLICHAAVAAGGASSRTAAAVMNTDVDDRLPQLEVNTSKLSVSSRFYQGGEPDAGGQCVVCWERQALFVVVPCGHICLCSNCSYQDFCPICRAQVSNTLRVYFSGI